MQLAELDPQVRYVIVLDDAHEADDALRLTRRLLGDGRFTAGVQIVATTHPAAQLTNLGCGCMSQSNQL